MSLAFKNFFKDMYFCKLLSQVVYTVYVCKSKMCFNKCLSYHEELLYLINVLLNFEV